MVQKQGEIDIAGDWGGGHVASADGMRFTVPVRSLHARERQALLHRAQGDLAQRRLGPRDGPGRHRDARHPARLPGHPGRGVQPR
ncbi:Tn3 family transposase [Streptomyces sp. NPDC058989]|uniref:Tn3 family transposase n=1 Tax=Streptomyces sp. NPDC058989 TaxID=3346686 RepID=UPI0036D04F47